MGLHPELSRGCRGNRMVLEQQASWPEPQLKVLVQLGHRQAAPCRSEILQDSDLVVPKARMVDAEKEHDPDVVAAVLDLVYEGIVEDHEFACLPSPLFVSHLQPALVRDDQRQVYAQNAVRRASVRRQHGSGIQGSEHHHRLFEARNRIQNRNGLRTSGTVLFVSLVEQIEVKVVPTRLDHAITADIGLKPRSRSLKKAFQLGAYPRVGIFEHSREAEVGCVVKGPSGDSRYEEVRFLQRV